MEACEAIERHQDDPEENKKKNKSTRNENGKSGFSTRTAKKSGDKKFYCTLHKENTTHDTPDCWALNKKKKGDSHSKHENTCKTGFSSKAFRKELNMLAQNSSKEKVLEQFSAAIAREKARFPENF